MARINYKSLDKMAAQHNITLKRDRDEDGPCVLVANCFASSRDAFLRAVDERWPGKYHREYTGALSVWLRPM